MKRGQVWVETVIYTLIVLVLISSVLFFVKPKIEEMQDKVIIEQSIGMMEDINMIVLSLVQGGMENKRKIEFEIKQGVLMIDGVNDKLILEIESQKMYSEPGEDVYYGDILVHTEKKDDLYVVTLVSDYNGIYNLTFEGEETIKILNEGSNPYTMFITNQGELNDLTILNVDLSGEGLNNEIVEAIEPVNGEINLVSQDLKNIEYATINGEHLFLDLYLPDSSVKPKVILFIHSGGWVYGDKSEFDSAAKALREKGYCTILINYRLANFDGTGAVFPAQIYDVKAAVRWIRAHADEYQLDTTKIGVVGSSAGAHLGAILGTTDDISSFEGTVGGNLAYSSRVDAVITLSGVFDLLNLGRDSQNVISISNQDFVDGLVSAFLDCNINNISCNSVAIEASPITYVTNNDAAFLVYHGDADELIPFNQSINFNQKLINSCINSELRLLLDEAHGVSLNINEADEFFKKYLYNANNVNSQCSNVGDSCQITASLSDYSPFTLDCDSPGYCSMTGQSLVSCSIYSSAPLASGLITCGWVGTIFSDGKCCKDMGTSGIICNGDVQDIRCPMKTTLVDNVNKPINCNNPDYCSAPGQTLYSCNSATGTVTCQNTGRKENGVCKWYFEGFGWINDGYTVYV
ncbi:MAG TPA: alpha/beta hydrolase [Candidatus Nanoarchaeia archaeon]|nr:alpha/beta hydrolase [Candidatus Nanoarchaeia archaeon]